MPRNRKCKQPRRQFPRQHHRRRCRHSFKRRNGRSWTATGRRVCPGRLEKMAPVDPARCSSRAGRQLIVEAWISLEVGEIDGVARQVEAMAGQRGGWVESADIVGEAGYRTASINVRVPAERFNDAMQTLRGLGRVNRRGGVVHGRYGPTDRQRSADDGVENAGRAADRAAGERGDGGGRN